VTSSGFGDRVFAHVILIFTSNGYSSSKRWAIGRLDSQGQVSKMPMSCEPIQVATIKTKPPQQSRHRLSHGLVLRYGWQANRGRWYRWWDGQKLVCCIIGIQNRRLTVHPCRAGVQVRAVRVAHIEAFFPGATGKLHVRRRWPCYESIATLVQTRPSQCIARRNKSPDLCVIRSNDLLHRSH
jgi:hypothetical protein